MCWLWAVPPALAWGGLLGYVACANPLLMHSSDLRSCLLASGQIQLLHLKQLKQLEMHAHMHTHTFSHMHILMRTNRGLRRA